MSGRLTIGDPHIGDLERTMFGSWGGEVTWAPGRRVSVTYVAEPADSVPPAEIERAVRATVELVAREEEALRKTAAEAWLPTALEEVPAARGWDAGRLARSFTLVGILLGNTNRTFILEHSSTLPIDRRPKTWFNADGTLSHISGHLDQ